MTTQSNPNTANSFNINNNNNNLINTSSSCTSTTTESSQQPVYSNSNGNLINSNTNDLNTNEDAALSNQQHFNSQSNDNLSLDNQNNPHLTTANNSENNINSINDGIDIMPYGWEKVEDPEYGVFYIDHINKKTQYEHPLSEVESQSKQNEAQCEDNSMKTFRPSEQQQQQLNQIDVEAEEEETDILINGQQHLTNTNNNIKSESEKSNAMIQQQQQEQSRINGRNCYFTQNPDELKGEFIRTKLLKSHMGFGFTIIGANETNDDFLQIKYIVPDGAAARDGQLRQGDVLVYVNNECVLGYTHQNVVEIFQSIPIGQFVELTVCRGYPLSIDPNDPNIEIMPLAAINNHHYPHHHHHHHQTSQMSPGAPLASADDLASINNSHKLNSSENILLSDEYYCEEYEELYAPIVKGPKGFGFTIADDAQMNHQKVKQILDRERCVNLRENDILLEINGYELKNLTHNQVVDLLKECQRGQETLIKLKRRKYQITLPQPPSTSSLNNHMIANAERALLNEPNESKNNANLTQLPSTIESNVEIINKNNGDFRAAMSSLRQTNFCANNSAHTSHQIAFNLERRSKTPNILQQSTAGSSNFMPNNSQASRSSANLTSLNQAYQPQLRSKTPTTDRFLFQSQTPHDYAYLNGQAANHKQQKIDIEHNVPIYEQTQTTVRHQKFGNSCLVNTQFTNRSKTPGPDMIYYRNPNDFANTNGNAFMNSRSKTPTADIMYYPHANTSPKQVHISEAPPNGIYTLPPYDIDELIALVLNNEVSLITDVDGNYYLEMMIDLHRQETGFGFRIVGGEEESSQVSVGYIVNGGAAHQDGRLRPNDEIIMIDSECVLGATHRRVVQLMTIAGLNRRVKLILRRKLNYQQYKILLNTQQQQLKSKYLPSSNVNISPVVNSHPSQIKNNNNNNNNNNGLYNANTYPYTVTLFRNSNEGFGFVIISTLHKNGPSIGKIVENSPAERCKRLSVGDRILAVNGINITQMNHIEVVRLIKESGNSITLTIGPPNAPIDENSYLPEKPHITNEYMLPNGINNLSLNRQASSHYISPVSAQLTNANTTKAIINQNEYHVIELRKPPSGGFGFSIRGGREFNIPLFVLKLADNGPAALDGRLQVGDQILEINSQDAYNMTHGEAIERIKQGGNSVTLLVRRTGLPPPSITDIIAVNSSVQHQQQQQQQQQQMAPSLSTHNINNDINQGHVLRPKSPYIIQNGGAMPSKAYQTSSSSALINRNY